MNFRVWPWGSQGCCKGVFVDFPSTNAPQQKCLSPHLANKEAAVSILPYKSPYVGHQFTLCTCRAVPYTSSLNIYIDIRHWINQIPLPSFARSMESMDLSRVEAFMTVLKTFVQSFSSQPAIMACRNKPNANNPSHSCGLGQSEFSSHIICKQVANSTQNQINRGALQMKYTF